MKSIFYSMLLCLVLSLQAPLSFAQAQAGLGVPLFRAVPVLPYGVEDILKLSRAGISDTIILRYMEVAAIAYQLEPDHLIYLRDQGVSEPVVHAMLEQRIKFQNSGTSGDATVNTPSPPPVADRQNNTAHQCPLHCGSCGGLMFTHREPQRPVSTLHIIPYSSPVGLSHPYRIWGPYRYYSSAFVPSCGWWPYTCGHWHGCRPWLP
jgi:hypothetical protein